MYTRWENDDTIHIILNTKGAAISGDFMNIFLY